MKTLTDLILELTKDIEKQTVQYYWNSIPQYIEEDKTLYERVKQNVSHIESRRERTYATASEIKNLKSIFGITRWNICERFRVDYIKNTQENLIKFINKDFNTKRESLLNKINKKLNSRKVIEISSINRSVDGQLNAYLKLDDGVCLDIYTIYAGGYNIQQLHYRSLIKERK